jgi:hypothetical protein
MYIDSALKSNKNANANANANTEHETSHTNNEKKISYKDFKMSKC